MTIALPLFFVWEMLQMPTLTGLPDEGLTPVWLCGLVAVGDAIVVLLAYACGCWIFRSTAWFRRPTIRRYTLVVAVALAVQVIVEWVGVYRLGVWGYPPGYPVVPGLGIAVTALLQSLLLPPLVFWLASRSLTRPARV